MKNKHTTRFDIVYIYRATTAILLTITVNSCKIPLGWDASKKITFWIKDDRFVNLRSSFYENVA